MKLGFYPLRSQYSSEIETEAAYGIITLRVRDNKAKIEIALASKIYT